MTCVYGYLNIYFLKVGFGEFHNLICINNTKKKWLARAGLSI
jgi:hypothetical protein